MFLAGMFAISGAFVSCDDSDDTDGVNKLEVTPSTDISFKADGNEDVVLTVVTDAENGVSRKPTGSRSSRTATS